MKKLCLLFVSLSLGCAQEKGLEKEQTNKKPEAIQTDVASTVVETDNKCKACVESIYAETEPDTAFDFSNGQRLLICGGSEIQDKKKVYSEFVISECGNNTLIGFWGAVEKYGIEYVKDTLKLSKVELLAIGENRELTEKTWLTEYFYYQDNELQRVKKLNPKIAYSQSEIDNTLQEYEATKWMIQIESSQEYTEEKMRLANRLLVAAVSGSRKAEQYFKEFASNFKPDGVYSEWYSEMESLLEFAKKQRKNSR
ncbi:hypothetical protein [Rufibacter immobilis]|uniref:hypothetical protein n=1 Tax=Rufibacter immobilis TaxID=1348778 RepID=UPI0035E4CD9A